MADFIWFLVLGILTAGALTYSILIQQGVIKISGLQNQLQPPDPPSSGQVISNPSFTQIEAWYNISSGSVDPNVNFKSGAIVSDIVDLTASSTDPTVFNKITFKKAGIYLLTVRSKANVSTTPSTNNSQLLQLLGGLFTSSVDVDQPFQVNYYGPRPYGFFTSTNSVLLKADNTNFISLGYTTSQLLATDTTAPADLQPANVQALITIYKYANAS